MIDLDVICLKIESNFGEAVSQPPWQYSTVNVSVVSTCFSMLSWILCLFLFIFAMMQKRSKKI